MKTDPPGVSPSSLSAGDEELLTSTPGHYGLPALYLTILLLALTGLYAKVIPLDAISMIQLRGVVATISLGLFGRVRGRSFRLPDKRSYAGVYALGLLLGIHWVTFFHAMQVSSVAVGMLSMFSYPVMTIFLEPLFQGQGWKKGDIAAGFIALAGLGVMLLQGEGGSSGAVTAGVFWGVCSALLFALRNLFQKYRFSGIPSDSLMFHQLLMVALLLVLFVDYPGVARLSWVNVLEIIMLGTLTTATAHTLLVYSLKQLPAKSVALISCLQPVIAACMAWLVIHEVPGPSVMIGGGIVLSVAAYESARKRSAA